ncbi:hypothetical protein PQX77_012736 [Marasmius sp. AFHP31]|nr:hypothetical protein PQX77_012736 [Marasmius sp. AFHP31]
MTVHVNGDQINQIVQQKEKERTEFDDFRNVMSGSGGINAGSVNLFTAVSYSGPDACKAFEADFRTYSRALSSQVAQIYAIDLGSVPSLLLRNELVPLAHIEGHISLSVQLHLLTLLRQWDCEGKEVWIDFARGIICRGPAGPESELGRWWDIGVQDVPSTVDFLQEDVVLHFIANFARHLGYAHIVFQPINKPVRIEEIYKEQISGQPPDPHVNFIVYNSDGHTSDSDGDFTTNSGDSSDSGSDYSTNSNDNPSSESKSRGLSNTPEQGQLIDLASSGFIQTRGAYQCAPVARVV